MVKAYKKWICDKCMNELRLPVNYELRDTIADTYEDIVCICSGKTNEDFEEDYLNYFNGAWIKFREGKEI